MPKRIAAAFIAGATAFSLGTVACTVDADDDDPAIVEEDEDDEDVDVDVTP